ncbi:MAG: TrkH family potassium uptake protein [Dehalococcoidales bacterium]|nr:TrkH family potassium uptake protein [Dehalococcoidales bacterium]
MTLVYGFAAMIAAGTILLALPVSSKSGEWTPFVDALFTATSGVCVTGLVVVDTLDYWSYFGQAVVLVLIQLGGFGFMTSTTVALIALGRKIGLRERLLIGESIGIATLGDMIRVVKGMLIFTIIAEVIGTIIFFFRFSSEYSTGLAIWKSLFQSVSAFNNAGFDIFGGFRSISGYQGDFLVVLTTAALVFLGGISFLVVQDVIKSRGLRKLSLDSKLVLSMTAVLVTMGMAVVLFTEYGRPDTLGAMTLSEKLLNAFFQSVTSRTAGFSTIHMANMANYALFFIMLLMFVGGASGSTAGGIKVNTLGLVLATIWSSIKGREHPGAFGKEFMNQQIFRALAIIMISIGVVSIVVFLLTVTEKFAFLNILFEVVSAFGTVGLSTGITPDLSTAGRLLITATMFAGRLGPVTLALALVKRQQPTKYRYSKEVVRIG